MKVSILYLLIAILTSANTSLAQSVSFSSIHEIRELYEDGQYSIVKAKLVNEGFSIDKSLPDYTLRGVEHKGDFSMTYEPDSPSAFSGSLGSKQYNKWTFSTIIAGDTKEVDISFALTTPSALTIYNDFAEIWTHAYGNLQHQTYLPTEQGIRYYGYIGNPPKGYDEWRRVGFYMSDYSTKSEDRRTTPNIHIYGSFFLSLTKMAAVSPLHSVKKLPSTKRLKKQ